MVGEGVHDQKRGPGGFSPLIPRSYRVLFAGIGSAPGSDGGRNEKCTKKGRNGVGGGRGVFHKWVPILLIEKGYIGLVCG